MGHLGSLTKGHIQCAVSVLSRGTTQKREPWENGAKN